MELADRIMIAGSFKSHMALFNAHIWQGQLPNGRQLVRVYVESGFVVIDENGDVDTQQIQKTNVRNWAKAWTQRNRPLSGGWVTLS